MHSVIEINGLKFRTSAEFDPDHGVPWEESDGWGVIDRTPSADHIGDGWFYHQPESLARAIDEEWGVPEPVRQRLHRQLQREPTRSEILHEAVRIDRAAAAAYIAGEWHYVTVTVELLNLDGDGTGLTAALGGVESNAPDYIASVAVELAEELAARFPTQQLYTKGAVSHRIRPGSAKPHRQRNKPVRHWNDDVYLRIKVQLQKHGRKTKEAHTIACTYAKLPLSEAEAFAKFRTEYPSVEAIA